jgi:hypothetical protein
MALTRSLVGIYGFSSPWHLVLLWEIFLIGPDTSRLEDYFHILGVLVLVLQLRNVPRAVLVLVDFVLLHMFDSETVVPVSLLSIYL